MTNIKFFNYSAYGLNDSYGLLCNIEIWNLALVRIKYQEL
jgi:hypothetical protein